MDDVQFLADDHALLSSQVIHVVALVRAATENRFELAELRSEIARQADILHDQLAEHFDFEETTAFPRLEEIFPAYAVEFQQFSAEHDSIMQAFDEFRTELRVAPANWDESSLLAKAVTFEQQFERHATTETRLLGERAKQSADK